MPMSDEDAQREQIEIAHALEAATENITEVVEILLTSVDDSEAVMRLSKLLGISEDAALSVCDAQLRQLTITRRSRRADWLAENGG
jgi:DNA gyrase/topoisomerase IV subunit A